MLMWLLACEPDPEDFAATSDTGDSEDDAGSDSALETGEVPPGPECDSDGSLKINTPFNVLAAHVVAGVASESELADLRFIVEEWAPGRGGPWEHGVRGPFVSADAASFGGEVGVVHAPASVPDVVRLDAETLVMIHVDGDLDALLDQAEAHTPMRGGLVGLGGLAAATSPDGVNWTRVDLVFDSPLPTYAVDPEIIALPGGGWALYFYGVPAAELCANAPDPFLVPGVHRLFRAASADLLHWTAATEVWQNPEGGVDPAVWCLDESICYGWFSGGLRSDDGGLTFAASEELSMSWFPQVPEVVQLADGSWRMYSLVGMVIEAASSADGVVWERGGATGALSGSPTAVAGEESEVWLWTSASSAF